IAKCLLVSERVIPDETRRGPGQRIGTRFLLAAGIAARKLGSDLPLHVSIRDPAIRPLMAIGALHARTIGIVEQNELSRDLVLIRRELFAERTKLGQSVSFRHIAK